jgi:TonB family protein
VLELVVGTDGAITDARVTSGTPPFDEAALRAVRAWRFEPARREGRPVAARIRYTLRFAPTTDGPSPRRSSRADARGSRRSAADRGRRAGRAARTGHGHHDVGRRAQHAGAFGDPLRAVEAQPGVVPIVSGVPSFFVRGAPPANVGFFIDGIDVPILYHAFLGPSVLHPNVIESVDVYRGAAPVEYGRSRDRPSPRTCARFRINGTARGICA